MTLNTQKEPFSLFMLNSYALVMIIKYDDVHNKEPHKHFWEGFKQIDQALRQVKPTLRLINNVVNAAFFDRVEDALNSMHLKFP